MQLTASNVLLLPIGSPSRSSRCVRDGKRRAIPPQCHSSLAEARRRDVHMGRTGSVHRSILARRSVPLPVVRRQLGDVYFDSVPNAGSSSTAPLFSTLICSPVKKN